MVKKIEISQQAKYTCSSCQDDAIGVWHCGSIIKTVADAAWMHNTASADTVKSDIRRLRELKDQQKCYHLRLAQPLINGFIYRPKGTVTTFPLLYLGIHYRDTL
ncbi:60S ribosomal protein L37a [Lemmus lemmus]